MWRSGLAYGSDIAGRREGRIARREAEVARRIRDENARIRREHELELQRRKEELLQKQMIEREKVDSLLEAANSWDQSRILRDYLMAVEIESADGPGQVSEESGFQRWLRWGREQADRLAPLTRSPPSVLDSQIE